MPFTTTYGHLLDWIIILKDTIDLLIADRGWMIKSKIVLKHTCNLSAKALANANEVFPADLAHFTTAVRAAGLLFRRENYNVLKM